jgi:hypothetical protein
MGTSRQHRHAITAATLLAVVGATLASLWVWSAVATGNVYCVATDGSDSNPGTIDSPG